MPLIEALRGELLALEAADQARRTDPGHFQRFAPEDVSAEYARTERIAEIIDEYGWPGVSLVGEDGSSAAWLLVQHADSDVGFQERALALLMDAVETGQANARDAAFLTDRVRTGHGRAQLYGTQFRAENGTATPLEIEDPNGLDERRARAGLEPFAENKARIQNVIDEMVT